MLFNCQHLSYSIDERHILRNVSLQLSAGESVALLGTNGAGKSTLLKLMLGILTPQSGKIELHNKPLNQWRRRDIAKHIAYVP
ncbi:TPA: ATP-binding cassette domain-containing protein, partial [Photobacterium damselae]